MKSFDTVGKSIKNVTKNVVVIGCAKVDCCYVAFKIVCYAMASVRRKEDASMDCKIIQ